MAQLQEIREEEASDEILAAYDDVRATMGVPFVNLIHRYLATIPDALPFLWARVKPAFADGRIDAAVDAVFRDSSLVPLDEEAQRRIASSLDASDAVAASRVIDVYNRGNPCNLIVFHALIRFIESASGGAVESASGGAVESAGVAGRTSGLPGMPRLLRLAELPPPLRSAIERLVAAQGLSETGIVPSLWLHLAHWSALIETASDVLVPLYEAGTLPGQVASVIEVAKKCAADIVIPSASLPPSLVAHRAQVLDVLRAFTTGAIPNMVVAGYHLRQALRARTLPFSAPEHT